MAPYVGTRDVMMLHSVVDIAGLNRISRAVLDNAAAAMAGMILHPKPPAVAAEKPIVTATMFGVTTPCVEAARAVIEKAGYEVLVFHATGSGGRTIKDGVDATDAMIGYLKSTRARNKVRAWFRQLDLEHSIASGRQALDRELLQGWRQVPPWVLR